MNLHPIKTRKQAQANRLAAQRARSSAMKATEMQLEKLAAASMSQAVQFKVAGPSFDMKSIQAEARAMARVMRTINERKAAERKAYHSKRLRNSRKYREVLRAFRALSPEDQAAIWRARKVP